MKAIFFKIKVRWTQLLETLRKLFRIFFSKEEEKLPPLPAQLKKLKYNLVPKAAQRALNLVGQDTGSAEGGGGGPSILKKDSKTMYRSRRISEQEGHRKLAKVHAREHSVEENPTSGLEEGMHSGFKEHPNLNSQRLDGIDPNVSPEPALNTDARKEFDERRNEQELQKQLRLGNAPAFGTTPRADRM